MARTWLSITVELVEGGTLTLWPRPGRVLAAARTHTFADLSDAIDECLRTMGSSAPARVPAPR